MSGDVKPLDIDMRRFLKWLGENGYAATSIVSYGQAFRAILRKAGVRASQIRREHLADYLSASVARGAVGYGTLARAVCGAAIKAFRLSIRIEDLPSVPDPPTLETETEFSVADLERLWGLDMLPVYWTMFRLAYAGCVTKEEMLALKRADVDTGACTVRIGEHVIWIEDPLLWGKLLAYLLERAAVLKLDGPLFVHPDGRSVSDWTTAHAFRLAMCRIGKKNVKFYELVKARAVRHILDFVSDPAIARHFGLLAPAVSRKSLPVPPTENSQQGGEVSMVHASKLR